MSGRSFVTRSATFADLDDLLDIEQSCYAFPWSRQQFIDELDNPASLIEAVLVDERIVGYICFWLICGELQIQNLAIRPEYRRLGIAQALLEDVIERCRQQGMNSVWLEVREDNHAAIGLYLGCGFVISGRRKKYYQDGEDALLLSRIFK